jgi:hypothetical protein
MYLPSVRAAFARASLPEGADDDRYADDLDEQPDILDAREGPDERIRPPE